MMSASLFAAARRGSGAPPWTPADLPSLYVYDNNRRTATWNSGVTTENTAETTVMCWLRPDSVTGFQGAVVMRGNTTEHFRVDQNVATTRAIDSSVNLGSYGGLAVNTWQHVAWRYYGAGTGNSQRLRVWIDAVEQTPSYSGTIVAALASASGKEWCVGRSSNNGINYPFGSVGAISQTIICGAALSDADIVAAHDYTLPLR